MIHMRSLGIFRMFCSVRENGFMNASIQCSSSAQSLKRLSKAFCINMIFSMCSVKLARSSAHALCSFNYGNLPKIIAS